MKSGPQPAYLHPKHPVWKVIIILERFNWKWENKTNRISFPLTPEGIMQQTKNVQSCTFCCWACIFALHSFLRVWKGKKREREKREQCIISLLEMLELLFGFSLLPLLPCSAVSILIIVSIASPYLLISVPLILPSSVVLVVVCV